MEVVEQETETIKIYILSKHKQHIDAANILDKQLSEKLKMERMQRYIEQQTIKLDKTTIHT